MKPPEWNEVADHGIARFSGDGPLDVMLRASFEHSKTVNPSVAPSADDWCDTCQAELMFMLERLHDAGYKIVRR